MKTIKEINDEHTELRRKANRLERYATDASAAASAAALDLDEANDQAKPVQLTELEGLERGMRVDIFSVHGDSVGLDLRYKDERIIAYAKAPHPGFLTGSGGEVLGFYNLRSPEPITLKLSAEYFHQKIQEFLNQEVKVD